MAYGTDYTLVAFLQELGHDVTSIAYDYPAALKDTQVLSIAASEQRTLMPLSRHRTITAKTTSRQLKSFNRLLSCRYLSSSRLRGARQWPYWKGLSKIALQRWPVDSIWSGQFW